MTDAQLIEGVRDADESSLPPQASDRFARWKPGGNGLAHESRQQLSSLGQDFFADDDAFGIELLGSDSSGNRVMVGDDYP
jgi:hypothetical protein